MNIYIREEKLGDGSLVYNVIVDGFGSALPAITKHDAAELAQKIQFAIHDHTNERASLIWFEWKGE